MYIKRLPNLQRRKTISTAQIMRIPLLGAAISVDCRNDVKKVAIMRGENRVFINSTVEVFFYGKRLSLNMAKFSRNV